MTSLESTELFYSLEVEISGDLKTNTDGGAKLFSDQFLRKLRDLCDEQDIPMHISYKLIREILSFSYGEKADKSPDG